MTNKNKIYNKTKYLKMIQSPILFAGITFVFSIITATVFYSIIDLMLNLCNIEVIKSMLFQLNRIPLFLFDEIFICVQILIYTFNFKEKILFIRILKISLYYLLFASIRMIILWHFTLHSEQTLYYFLDLISSTLQLFGLFIITIVGLKIINISSLKFLSIKENIINR